MKLVEVGNESLIERVDAYLDGLLSPAEARATERMLVDPEVAALLAEAIALREVLASAADAPTPPDLAERIIASLDVAADSDVAAMAEVDGATDDDAASVGRSALYGASWMVRGAGAEGGARAARAGADALRYALGPLALLGAANAEPVERRAWWRLGRRSR